jgi:hypothetical protein
MRLVQKIGQASVDRPYPPCCGQLQREVASALVRTPTAKVEMFLSAEERKELYKAVVPIVIAGKGVYRRAS